MKGFLQWFKSSTKMKRWMFLILVGIVLACYALAQLLVLKEITFMELAKVIVVFVAGFTFVVLGLIFIQKRTLELLIEATDSRMDAKNVNVKSLIFNKKVYNDGPKIVVIGGGNGINAVLEGLKKYTNNITAIVTISDYGNMVSDSRRELNLLPLEDIKNSISALAVDKVSMEYLLNHKFETGRLKGLDFGDIYLTATREIYGDLTESIKRSSDILNIVGKVLPVTLDEIKICAELEDGDIIEEKSKIPEAVFNKVSKIHRIFITPTNCKVAPGVLEAIKEADAIIIGPGSLYTNIIPNLLVKGVAKQIKESKAIKVYVSNIMTEPGQTDNYSFSEHIDAIIEHAGKGVVDYCIHDTQEIIPEFIKRYNEKGSDLVELDTSKVKDIKVIQRQLAEVKGEYIRHNPDLLAATIIELICDDYKYKDKQNDPQFVRLNTKLKEEKKKHKVKKRKVKKHKQDVSKKTSGKRKKSKFAEKYSERIESIQNSEKTREENLKQLKYLQAKEKNKNKNRKKNRKK